MAFKASSEITVSLLQMTSTSDAQKNLQTILTALKKTNSACLFVPENSLYFNTSKGPLTLETAFSPSSPEIETLRSFCSQEQKRVHLGGIPWRVGGKVMNGALLIEPNGDLQAPYLKTHLFDLELDGMRVMESDSYTAGVELQTFEIQGWVFATAICYDLRFAEIFCHYRWKMGVDAFVVPSAFTAKTGAAHWQTLLQARAIEFQSYVLAPAQVGGHWSPDKSLQRKTWGQTMAVDPWGRILAQDKSHTNYDEFKDSQGSPIDIVLRHDEISKVRAAMPMEQHRAFTLNLESRCLIKKL